MSNSREPNSNYYGGGSPWEPHQAEQLFDLIRAGTSPAQAADTLRKTRNQVIGLAARRGWRFQSCEHVLAHATAKLREDEGLPPRLGPTVRRFSWETDE